MDIIISKTQVKNRDISLDKLKGLAIILVVIGHLLWNNNTYTSVIYSVHMPIFFFVSGYLDNSSRKKHKSNVYFSSKFKRIMLPFLCWTLVAIGFNSLISLLHNGFSFYNILQNIKQCFILSPSLWYLLILFLTYLIFSFDLFLKSKIGIISHFIIWFLIILLPNKFFSFGDWAHFYPLFILGYYFANYKKIRKFISKKQLCLPFLLFYIFFSVFGVLYFKPIHSNVNFNEYLMTLYAYIWAITGVATMYNLMNRTANRLIEKPLILFGEFSLDIYCIHMFLVRDFVFIPKFILQSNALIEAIYATIYGIGVCFIIAFLVKNFLRKIFLYRILFSGVK